MLTSFETPAGVRSGIMTALIEEPHLVIAGCTGSGKSVLLHGIIYRLLQEFPFDAKLYLCDPKMVELRRYKDLPHCIEFADTPATIEQTLKHVHAEMITRFNVMKSNNQREYNGGHVYCIVDEFADLITHGKQIEYYIESIGKLGRAAHVHLILATQAPSRKVLKANIMLNMTGRVGLRCKDSIESRQIIGRTGCESLPRYGSFYFDSSIYGFQRIDSYPYYTDDDIDAMINHWAPQKPGRLLRWILKLM